MNYLAYEVMFGAISETIGDLDDTELRRLLARCFHLEFENKVILDS